MRVAAWTSLIAAIALALGASCAMQDEAGSAPQAATEAAPAKSVHADLPANAPGSPAEPMDEPAALPRTVRPAPAGPTPSEEGEMGKREAKAGQGAGADAVLGALRAGPADVRIAEAFDGNHGRLLDEESKGAGARGMGRLDAVTGEEVTAAAEKPTLRLEPASPPPAAAPEPPPPPPKVAARAAVDAPELKPIADELAEDDDKATIELERDGYREAKKKRKADLADLEEETGEEAPGDEDRDTLLARDQSKEARQRNRDGDSRNREEPALAGLGLIDGRYQMRIEDPLRGLRHVRPHRFLPRMCYFENTYLGGNAAYEERLRRLADDFGGRLRPFEQAALPPQAFDPPIDAGLALTTELDRLWLDQPGRVVLQIGLQGSERFGWRRPPLDVMLVVDQPAVAGDAEALTVATTALLRRLGPQDRLGIIVAGAPAPLADLGAIRDLRGGLARALEGFRAPPDGGPAALATAMARAGARLFAAAGDTARVPGTQTVIVLTRDGDPGRVAAATGVAHQLSTQGAVTSVVQLGAAATRWWAVANAGHGNYHRAPGREALAAALDTELDSLARVIARLLRVNVRLAPHVEAIRVIGSRVLGQDEVVEVKAREVATDRNLSRSLGLKADRGDDDDGIQTVIPYFYGGDAHVILIELWVEKPGPVADVTLRYKDMVKLDNATARASAALGRIPRDDTPAQAVVRRNFHGFDLAAVLDEAATYARRGDAFAVSDRLTRAEQMARQQGGGDLRVVEGFQRLVRDGMVQREPALLGEALEMASRRRIGHSPAPRGEPM